MVGRDARISGEMVKNVVVGTLMLSLIHIYREVLVHFSEDWGLFGIYYFTIYKLLFAVRGDGAL